LKLIFSQSATKLSVGYTSVFPRSPYKLFINAMCIMEWYPEEAALSGETLQARLPEQNETRRVGLRPRR
jgi:hypothetical protein